MSSITGLGLQTGGSTERRLHPGPRPKEYASAWQRMRGQVWTVLRQEISLSLYLLLFAVSVLPWALRLGDEWVLWVALDRELGTSGFFLSVAASVVAFVLGQRDTRNPITELQAGTVASRRDVVLARMVGMVVVTWIYVTVLVAGTYMVGMLFADWGRPDVRVLVPMYLWPVFVMPLLVTLGDRASRIDGVRPIIWLVVVAVASWFVHVTAWFPFGVSMIEVLTWPSPPPHTVPSEMFTGPTRVAATWQWMLAGGGVLAVAVLALPSRFGTARVPTRAVLIAAVSVAFVALVLTMGVGLRNGTGYPSRTVTGDLSVCVSGDLYEACGHPAYEGLIEQHQPDIAAVLAVIEGANVLPVQISFVPVDRWPVGDPPFDRPLPDRVALQTQPYGTTSSENFRQHLVQQIFTIEGWSAGDGSVANVVRAWWLLELGFSANDTPQLATWLGEHDKLPGGYELPEYPAGYGPPDLSPHILRFSSLPHEARLAWLEANWDAIRAGELTLEDLP